MNKSAKEMFEEIGYVKTNLLSGNSINYEHKKYETGISFFGDERTIHIYPLGHTYQDSGFIGFEDLQAINKQVEELGWKNE